MPLLAALETSLLAAALRVGSSVSLPDLFAIVTPYVGRSGCSDASGEGMSKDEEFALGSLLPSVTGAVARSP